MVYRRRTLLGSLAGGVACLSGCMDGDEPDQTYQSEFAFDHSDDTLTVTLTGGDRIPAEELTLQGDLDDVTTGSTWVEVNPDYEGQAVHGEGVTVTDDGDEYRWAPTNEGGEQARVRVVWEDSESDESSTLAKWSHDGSSP